MAISHPNCYHPFGMPPEERVLVRGPMSSADSTHPGHHKEPRRDDEQWTALLRWLREVHSVDVSEKSLLVERRDVQGALRLSNSFSIHLLTISQVQAKVCLPYSHVR